MFSSIESNFYQNLQTPEDLQKTAKISTRSPPIPRNPMENCENLSDDTTSEQTELNLCEELAKKLSSFDKIKQRVYEEGSYSQLFLQKKQKRNPQQRLLDELEFLENGENNKENSHNVLKEIETNRVLNIESLNNSHVLRKDIRILKQNLKEKIFLNSFYLQHSAKILRLQRFFREKLRNRRNPNKKQPISLIERLKSENESLKKENIKLKTANKSLILEMKNKIEKGLDEQKQEISQVIQKYSVFIEKLIKDKKELSAKCENFAKKLQEKEEELNNFRTFSQEKAKKTQKETSIAKNNQENQKNIETNGKEIEKLRAENQKLKEKYEKEIEELKSQNHKEFFEFESQIKEIIAKKDETIRKLNSLLLQMRKNQEDAKN